jgi:DNA-binding NtrC family response regulator
LHERVNDDTIEAINVTTRKLKILIAEDDDDTLSLYKDYFTSMGHSVIYSYLKANNLMRGFEYNLPDICIIDYKFPDSRNGIDAAIEILQKYPSMPILFITGYEQLETKIATVPFFQDKKFAVLVKPVMLATLQDTIMKLTAIRIA